MLNSQNPFFNFKEKSILVLGANGQVGQALSTYLGSSCQSLKRDQLDLAYPELLSNMLDAWYEKNPFTALINAAAYTGVDLAEKEKEKAFKVNADSPGILAEWCERRQIPLIHYSTDYVFSGEGQTPWKEQDPPSPINTYGQSKLEGEKKISEKNPLFLIFRTSWVYDKKGKNFPNTLLELGKKKEHLCIVNDQWGAPTYAPHLAFTTLKILENALKKKDFPTGIYHLCNEGETTWFELACLIFKIAQLKQAPFITKEVKPIATVDYPTTAKRPLNSRLCMDKLYSVFPLTLPHWKVGVEMYMNQHFTKKQVSV